MSDLPELILPDIAGSFMRGQEFGERMRQTREIRQRENGLASLMAQYFQEGQASPQMLSEVARKGGNAFALQKADRENIAEQAQQVATYGKWFLSLPPEQKAQAYPGLVERVNALKADHPPIPTQYDPSYDAP